MCEVVYLEIWCVELVCGVGCEFECCVVVDVVVVDYEEDWYVGGVLCEWEG